MKNDQKSKQLQETSALPCADRKGAFWPRKSAEGGADTGSVLRTTKEAPLTMLQWPDCNHCAESKIIKLEILLELNIKLTLTLEFDSGILSPCM